MNNTATFEPDWVSSPGATVLEILKERHLSIIDFAAATCSTPPVVARLLNGIEPVTAAWAAQLAFTLGASPDFWLRREDQYRHGFDRLCSKQLDANAWLDELPINDMVRFGWINKGQSRADTICSALTFFGVPSIESWKRRYAKAVDESNFRTSTSFEIKHGAVAAWIREGEIRAYEIDCDIWNPELLKRAIPTIRALTRNPNPTLFLPDLIEICARCGIAVVVAPSPDGCRASGATKFMNPTKALMLFSFRYLADDQYWFTVFHELGHLLLHSNDHLFLEGVEEPHSKAEDEANNFALLSLFSEAGVQELNTIPLNQFAISRFAKRIGISAGLVVGQLQEMKRVPFRHFNYLKARYSWNSD